MHLKRFFERPDGFGGKEPFKVAVVTVVNFGERDAGNISTAFKNKIAKANEHIIGERVLHMDDINVRAKYGENLE